MMSGGTGSNKQAGLREWTGLADLALQICSFNRRFRKKTPSKRCFFMIRFFITGKRRQVGSPKDCPIWRRGMS